jgi:hypothetical protein
VSFSGHPFGVCRLGRFAALVMWLAARVPLVIAAPDIAGSAYQADTPFPQFLHLWSENWALKGKDGERLQYASAGMPLGAYLHLHLHNSRSNTVPITDVKLEGASLDKAITFSDQPTARLFPASLRFSKLPQADIDRLLAAGEPVWWKVDPPSLPPGGFAEVTIRLRRQPKGPLTVQALASQSQWTTRIMPTNSPRFMGISFSPALDTVYCYVQHPQQADAEGRGASPGRVSEGTNERLGEASLPSRVLVDGEDVTSRSTIAADAAVNVAPLLIRLSQPLAKGSFHCFQAIYQDGSQAIAGVRAFTDEFIYGMWGYINQGSNAQQRVDYYLGDLQRHNVNAVMESYGGEVGAFLSGESGREHSRTTGIRAMRNNVGKVLNPVYYFLKDEPDAHDFAVRQLEPNQRLGTLGQDVVRRSCTFREQDPSSPQLLNLDNTYKPDNWYMYGQLPDVCCADPYFQEQQRIVWTERPAWAASFVKPLYVLGVATICNSACAPKPLHIILNSVRHDSKAGPFRFATPVEKTVELFYALGAGAKAFSYWWYTPYGEFHGCGAKDKEAVALWRQIGLLGAQVRTAGPVLTRSCPAVVPLKAPPKLWTRTLLAGTNTIVLLAVNDNIASDRLGTVVVPLPKTVVTLAPPTWCKPADLFEITPEGVQDLNWKSDAGQVTVDLGQTEVARLVLLTADKSLRSNLEELYRTRFAANVAQLTVAAAK